MFLRGGACLALQRLEQGGLADVAFADQHQFGFVERFGVLFETTEVCPERFILPFTTRVIYAL